MVQKLFYDPLCHEVESALSQVILLAFDPKAELDAAVYLPFLLFKPSFPGSLLCLDHFELGARVPLSIEHLALDQLIPREYVAAWHDAQVSLLVRIRYPLL